MKLTKTAQLLFIFLFCFTGVLHAQSLLWKVSGNGLRQPSFLYGTIHISAKEAFQFPEGTLAAFDSSSVYAMEILASGLADPTLIGRITMNKGTTLPELMKSEDYRFLDSLVTASTGLSLNLFNHIQPFFISALLEMSQFSSDSSLPLDLWFAERAEAGGKTVKGLETVDEQLTAIEVLSYQEQADYLVEEMRKDADSLLLQKMLKFYLKGDLESLLEPEFTGDMPAKLQKALVTDRNQRMANRLHTLLPQHPSVFVAVGALHLPGKGGIIQLLRKKGYVVEPINVQ